MAIVQVFLSQFSVLESLDDTFKGSPSLEKEYKIFATKS